MVGKLDRGVGDTCTGDIRTGSPVPRGRTAPWAPSTLARGTGKPVGRSTQRQKQEEKARYLDFQAVPRAFSLLWMLGLPCQSLESRGRSPPLTGAPRPLCLPDTRGTRSSLLGEQAAHHAVSEAGCLLTPESSASLAEKGAWLRQAVCRQVCPLAQCT